MKRKLIFVFLQCLVAGISFCQEPVEVSPDGIFDKVLTQYGDEYNLADIAIGDPFDAEGAPEGATLISCNSGYFDLYFEIGSGMEGNSQIEIDRRAVLCEVFREISQFINTPNPSVKVNILVRNINPLLQGYNATTNPTPAATSGALGFASSYYVLPSGAPTTTGIADNEIWKTINSGVDSYTNFVSPLTSSANSGTGVGFYHGYIALNFDNPNINWHLNLGLTTSASLYDMYSVALHEVTHALGFVSNIDVNGNSKLGPSYKYYSRYDIELQTQSNQSLITNTGTCSMYNYGFNPALNPNIMAPTSSTCPNHIEYAGSVNQLAYTPSTFSDGSSLHHLEDLCHVPTAMPDDEYYVMSNGNNTGPNFMKRYLKPEERSVLCDIGYNVNSTYGSAGNLSFYNYGGSACPGLGVVGINDGITAGGTFQYIANVGLPQPINGILANDFNAVSFECLEDVYGNGTPVGNAGPTSGTSFTYTATNPGFALVRYVPVSATGARGNITYVFIYVASPGCSPSPCTFVNNSDFENVSGCTTSAPIQMNCWSNFSNSPDIFKRNCTGSWFSVPTPTSNPPADTWNGQPNDAFYGLGSTGGLGSPHWNESVQTLLNNPLVPGNTYTISYRARLANDYSAFFLAFGPPLPVGGTGEITFAGTSSILAPIAGPSTTLPASLTQLGNPMQVVNNGAWQFVTQTFQYNPPAGTGNLNSLVIMNTSNMNTLTNQPYTYIYIDDVEIIEVSPATTLTLPPIVCINQTITDIYNFAPVGGGVFSGPGISLNTSGTNYDFDATVAGIGTHTITYVYTNAIGCVITIHQQVQVVNSTLTATASASPANVCVGQTVNLTGNSPGANSFVWNPGNLSGSSVNPIVNAPTLFTLTASNAAGCVATAQVSVGTLPSPTVTVSPSSGTTCPSQPLVLNASGANNYTWSPGQTISILSPFDGSNVSASPTSTTTYTVTGTDANGCTGTAQSTINIVPCPDCLTGTTISGTIGTNTFFTNLRIPNDLTVSGNLTLIGSNVKILPGVTITILPGATLNIRGAHLYGCQDMWQGIVVQPGGRVNVSPYTLSGGIVYKTALIEDAIVAIDFQNITTQQAAAVLMVENAVFNRNETSIKVQGYAFANASSIFSVKNTLFTCRNIYNVAAATWPLTSVVKATNGNTNLFLEPYISLTNYPLATLKAPLGNSWNSVFSKYGIWMKNVGTSSTSAPYIYNSVTLGSSIASEYNVFDYQRFAIDVTNTNLKVINTTIQFPKKITWNMNIPGIGTGIYTKKQGAGHYKLDVAGTAAQPNKFFGLVKAVLVSNYRNVQFVNNTIRSNRPVSQPFSGYLNGGFGIDIYVTSYDNVNITNNAIYNINTGVHLNSVASFNMPSIMVLNNVFNRTLGSTTGGYSSDAVLIENLYDNSGGNLWVNNNTISGAYRGITLKKWSRIGIRVNNNNIALSGISGYASPSHGISLENCIYGSATAQIYYNTVTGIQGVHTNAPNFKGIAITSSTYIQMNCNSVSTTYSGLYFHGNCNPTRTSNNSMQNHRYGFVLDNNGIIGQQGTPTAPADNKWLGTWNSTNSFKNACLNFSLTQNSPMFVRSTTPGSIYSTSGSVFNGASSYGYNANPTPTVTLMLVTNPPFVTSCAVVANPGGSYLTTNDMVEALEQSTDTTLVTNADNEAVMRDQTYRTLDTDTTLMDSSIVLANFYTEYQNSNGAQLLEVEKALAENNTTQAAASNASIFPENTLEESYQMYYEALRHFEDSSFTQADSLILMNLVFGCPTLQGGSVSQAVTLYNAVYQTAEVFENICPEYVEKTMIHPQESIEEKYETYRIYPIPNNGSFYLKGKIENRFSIEIASSTGSLVYELKFQDDLQQRLIHTALQSGTYIVLLRDEKGNILLREKIVILK